MALTAYVQQVQRLLNDENGQFYSVGDLQVYVNNGRLDLCKRTECLIDDASLSTANGVRSYLVSAISPPANLAGILNVRSIRITNLDGSTTVLESRPWQWATNYWLNGAASLATGRTTGWAQQNQGSVGTLWFTPLPAGTYVLTVEASWTPAQLTSDSTPEAIPYPWTDAVPYYGAYQAYLQSQRRADAEKMLAQYLAFIKSARLGVTPGWGAFDFPNPKAGQSSIDTTGSAAGQGVKLATSGEGTA